MRGIDGIARCSWTRLTRLQAQALTFTCLGLPEDAPNGVYRSLVMRGMLTGKHELTDEGMVRLCACRFLSPRLRSVLVERRGHWARRNAIIWTPDMERDANEALQEIRAPQR